MRSLIAIKHSPASNIDMLTHKGATVTGPLWSNWVIIVHC